MAKKSLSLRVFAHAAAAALLFLAMLTVRPEIGRSQANSATFYASVTDPTGLAVQGAAVTLTAEGTQATMTRTTNSSGEAAFSFVPVGVYIIKVDAPGFKSLVNTGLTLAAGQQIRQTLKLELGSVSETVTVDAAASLVNTVSSEQLQNYSATDARELPLQNRNFSGMLRINAGVTASQGNDGTGVDMNGVGRNGTVYSLDGTSASGNTGSNNPGTYQGGNLVDVMSVEGIQDVSAVKGAIPAEYEDAIGGQVNLVSRSGTNQWHGSLFENFQNRALNARQQFTTTKPRLNFNQFGGSFGGAIKKNKIFIFGDYEGYRLAESLFVNGDVPTQALRDQLVAAVPAYQLALQAFPLPNQPVAAGKTVGTFATTRTAVRNDDHYDAKGDYVISDNSRLSLSYNHGVPYRTIPRYFIDDPRTYYNELDRGSVSYITGGGSWTSESRFGYNRTIQDRTDQFFSLKNPLQSTESYPYGQRIPDILTNLGWGGPNGEINHSGGPLMQISEKYARYIGRHSLKFGGDYHRSVGTRNNPQIPDITYSSLPDLLANKPSQVLASLGSGIYSGHMYEFGFFAQDDWRATSKLSLNFGIRYDYYSNFVAEGGEGAPDAGLYNPSFLSMDGRFNVGPFRDRSKPYESDPVNFAPRFGFAYNPDGQSKTVIRGGYGLMFSNLQPENFWNLVSPGPNIPRAAVFAAADIAAFGIKYPVYNDQLFSYTQQLVKNNSNIRNITAIYNPNLQNPYVMQYTLDVQRQVTSTMVFQSAVVGTRGVKFPEFRVANVVDRVTGLRPNPNILGQPYYIDNSQNTTYYGWQNSFRKRFSSGFSFDANYTWSKALGNGGGDTGVYYDGENGTRNQNFFDLRADRGPTASDITHYFSGSWLYQLPGFKGQNPIIHHGLGGWQLAGIFSAQTGLPVIITQSSTTSAQRADYVGGNAVLPDYQSTLRYLNPAAFKLIPIGKAGAAIRDGNVGPGEVRAPGLWNLNFSIARNFTLHENLKLQIRTDMFNAFNHTNLSGLQTSVNNARFGQLTNTLGARIMQVNARISF
jgi:outer membrane receptor protein involved in Fe transport